MTVNSVKDIPSRPKARGSHAERSAQMRQRLIEAAITCLRRVGYAATTTQLVMEEANVSRGAMLHHFPTKVDLMIAVGEAAALHQNRYVRRRLSEIPAGMARFLALTHATWEAICEPPALAQTLEADQRNGVWDLAYELGIRDRDTIDRMVRLHLAAMRGLAIETMFNGDRAGAEESIQLLDQYTRTLTGALLTGTAGEGSPAADASQD